MIFSCMGVGVMMGGTVGCEGGESDVLPSTKHERLGTSGQCTG